MNTNKSILALGAIALMSSATFAGTAFAADMAMAPQPYYAPPAPPQEDFGGWYLRGDIGQTNSRGDLHYAAMDTFAASNTRLLRGGQGFAGGTSYGLGVGYQFNSWFRADLTGEYRSKVGFNATDFITFTPGGNLADNYVGGYSSWVGLANAYVDLGTWWCVTPFIGAGVGAAHIQTSGISDNGLSNGSPGSYFADGASRTNFAWAAHAGLAYKVNSAFTVELAYRYLDMGTAVHGFGRSYDGTNAGQTSFQYRDITSHDVKIGVRWNLDAPTAYAPPPPLVRKG
jgi:opacity protein-like surface antigen